MVSAQESGSPLGKLFAMNAESRDLWNGGQPKARFGKQEGVPLVDHLLAAGVSRDAISRVFDADGKILIPQELEFSYDAVSPEQLFGLLVARLRLVYDMINPSIDHGHEKGFTGHGGDDHILPVAKTTWELLLKAGASEAEQKLGIASALGHDLGMLFNRSVHPFNASRMMFALVPELAVNLRVAAELRKITILHDEKVAGAFFDLIALSCGVDTNEFYTRVREKFGLPALALIAADKADPISQRRTTQKRGVAGEILVSDPHTQLTVLGDTRGYHTESLPEGGERQIQTLTLAFQPLATEEQEAFHAPGKHRHETLVNQDYHTLHRDHGIPHFYTWVTSMLTEHVNRLGLEARALFALFPHLDSFHLKVVDDSAWKTIGYKTELLFAVHFDQVQPFLDFLSKKMVFPKKNSNITILDVPSFLRQESQKMRYMTVSRLIEDNQSGTTTIRHNLWESGHNFVQVSHDFNPSRDPESLEAYIEKLFQDKNRRGT